MRRRKRGERGRRRRKRRRKAGQPHNDLVIIINIWEIIQIMHKIFLI